MKRILTIVIIIIIIIIMRIIVIYRKPFQVAVYTCFNDVA